ncbi:neutral alpha-glucosidase C-like [Anthonomus grandis grandis]|uniref:neutral alpha-glucosidase C-like n=1 Tax=Anthonomus grandis grandis TaxID=2921223 RepID=UPI002165DECE|nr:neutral alpha-glucosidase C-like [Anthonomus grandis grandis]XP_050293642.1 neutral alpha-glucosidase C-like [Anthonomus grandis grandis]
MGKESGSTFIELSLKNREDPKEEDLIQLQKSTLKNIVCSKISKGIFIALFVAIICPILAYYLTISINLSNDDAEQYSCLIKDEFRIPCGNAGISQNQCEKAYCCYNTTTKQCYHYLPSKYFYTPNEDGTYSPSQASSPVGSISIQNIRFNIQTKNAKKLSLKIQDNLEESTSNSLDSTYFHIVQSEKKLILEIYDSDGDSLLSTAKGPVIASEYYWEWSFQLSNGTLFGLDRNLIKLDTTETLTKVIYKNKEDHATLPVFWVYLNGKFFGLAIRHDGPLEIKVLASNIIILRSLLGKQIELELTLGPTPEELYENQVENKIVPPLWSLGSHHCRKGDTIDLSEILETYAADQDSNFDTDCIHENLFLALQSSKKSEENITTLKSYITSLAVDKKFLFSLPPHILVDDDNPLYKTAKDLNLLYKYQSGIVYNGTYLNNKVVYPDYSNGSISEFIQIMFDWINTNIGIENIHGFVLNDNWPQDDSYTNVEKNEFLYYTEDLDTQMKSTLPWTLQGTDKVLHLEKHNSYGFYQNASLYEYLKTINPDVPLIISSTKRFGSTDSVIFQNFETSWENFKMYLNKMMFGSITGNTMLGLPVCGDTKNYNETLQEVLCMRWYIAAATMPFFRVSSAELYRDPVNMNSAYARRISVDAMKKRALLQDFYFTILNKKEPMLRPMYYNYYSDPSTFSLERQYAIGKDIIIAHPLTSGSVRIQVYLPRERGVWYEFWGGTMFKIKKYAENITIDSFEGDWMMFVSQGSIVALTDLNKFYLYIALDCSNAEDTADCTATGGIFKDGNSLQFIASNSTIKISGLTSECGYTLSLLKVYGYLGNTSYSVKYDKKNVDLCTSTDVTINYVDQ